MSTPTLPEYLRQLLTLAEIRGGPDLAELRAAVAALGSVSHGEIGRLEDRARAGTLRPQDGIPPSLAPKVRDIASGHADAVMAAARVALPSLVRHLLEAGAVTTDHALTLARELAVVTPADLHAALADGRLRRLPKTAAEKVQALAPALLAHHRPIPLGRAIDLLATTSELLAPHSALIVDTSPAGDVRRYEPFVDSPSLVVCSPDPPRVIDGLRAVAGAEHVLHATARRAIVSMRQTELDLRVAAPDEYGSVLFASTGSAAHVAAVGGRLRRPALCAREEEVYANAGLPWIPPELRHDSGEIEAAAVNALPRLVTRADVRGDLHMHSTYSDGQDTIEAMAAAAAALGYEYIAITDHSESATASRTLTLDQLARQRDEIARVGELYPGLTILHGIEVDILPDGRLDFADAILERLDIVLASLHDGARQDGAALTRRCIQAIRHPLVNVITHPANRIVGRRAGYPLDFPAVYAAARESGTALEVDGAPNHLDLDGAHAREAAAAGVTLTIDSDCHRARALELQITLGIGTARRGWVGPDAVLNCRALPDIRAFVAAKRSGTR